MDRENASDLQSLIRGICKMSSRYARFVVIGYAAGTVAAGAVAAGAVAQGAVEAGAGAGAAGGRGGASLPGLALNCICLQRL